MIENANALYTRALTESKPEIAEGKNPPADKTYALKNIVVKVFPARAARPRLEKSLRADIFHRPTVLYCCANINPAGVKSLCFPRTLAGVKVNKSDRCVRMWPRVLHGRVSLRTRTTVFMGCVASRNVIFLVTVFVATWDSNRCSVPVLGKNYWPQVYNSEFTVFEN